MKQVIPVKIYQAVDIPTQQIARTLSENNGEFQAKLFNQFAAELARGCEDKHNFELQLVNISDALDIDGKRLFLQIAELLKLKSN